MHLHEALNHRILRSLTWTPIQYIFSPQHNCHRYCRGTQCKSIFAAAASWQSASIRSATCTGCGRSCRYTTEHSMGPSRCMLACIITGSWVAAAVTNTILRHVLVYVQVDNDTMEMLRSLNMANLPGVKVQQVCRLPPFTPQTICDPPRLLRPMTIAYQNLDSFSGPFQSEVVRQICNSMGLNFVPSA